MAKKSQDVRPIIKLRSTAGTGYTYQWKRGNTFIANATSATHAAAESGGMPDRALTATVVLEDHRDQRHVGSLLGDSRNRLVAHRAAR